MLITPLLNHYIHYIPLQDSLDGDPFQRVDGPVRHFASAVAGRNGSQAVVPSRPARWRVTYGYGRGEIKWFGNVFPFGFWRCCGYVISQGQIDLFMRCVKYLDLNVASLISFESLNQQRFPSIPCASARSCGTTLEDFRTRWGCYISPRFSVSTKIAHLRSSSISTTDFHGESVIILWSVNLRNGPTWTVFRTILYWNV